MGVNEMLQGVQQGFQIFYVIGFLGFIAALVTMVLLLAFEDSSIASKIYSIGAVVAFQVGGFGINFIPTTDIPTFLAWTSPIGLIGGWALILLAYGQYWFDRKKHASN